jgi:hypothetical protein
MAINTTFMIFCLIIHNVYYFEKLYKNEGFKSNIMKLSTVIGSVNNNPEYYMFIPKQILFWNHFGIKFIAIFIGDKIPEELSEYSNNIILWSRNTNLNSAYVAQNIRLYYTALLDLPEDEMVMITDMDMLPCSPSYYKDGLDAFIKDDFIYYRNIDEEHKQIYMCYNAAHPDTWGKCFGIHSEQDIELKLYYYYNYSYNGIPGSNGWYTDQLIMYNSLIHYPNLKVLERPLRRLETWIYQRYLNEGHSNFFINYDDAHFHRSYFSNQLFIENAENQLLNS